MGGDAQFSDIIWRARPERTYVITVGIATYGIGPLWNLPYAAEQAVAFAEWAHPHGVNCIRVEDPEHRLMGSPFGVPRA